MAICFLLPKAVEKNRRFSDNFYKNHFTKSAFCDILQAESKEGRGIQTDEPVQSGSTVWHGVPCKAIHVIPAALPEKGDLCMKITVIGRQLNVWDEMKATVEKKLSKLD